ncbi:hypothetical protein H5410_035925 [Solanum commersonii]|uniref:Uncharacterized protein n=1 Tax=Solanum commersonii TaxID=4109 RepID=A0A9J5Y394_SOLCO|nr:hypothetical protein H5410_035925 [Solanum commersonii]
MKVDQILPKREEQSLQWEVRTKSRGPHLKEWMMTHELLYLSLRMTSHYSLEGLRSELDLALTQLELLQFPPQQIQYQLQHLL